MSGRQPLLPSVFVAQTVGAAYAYEYAWAGHIASGVYYYTIEAEKGGKNLKARGKFAVVR